MLALTFSGYPAVLWWKDVNILTEVLRRWQIRLYISELNCVPQSDVIELGSLCNW